MVRHADHWAENSLTVIKVFCITDDVNEKRTDGHRWLLMPTRSP